MTSTNNSERMIDIRVTADDAVWIHLCLQHYVNDQYQRNHGCISREVQELADHVRRQHPDVFAYLDEIDGGLDR